MQYFESEACWRPERARRGSSTPKRSAFSRPSASAATSGSSAFATRVARGVEPGNGVAPALGNVLELAVAVELVAEEVAEAHDAGTGASHHLGEDELVDLEQPEIRAVRG